MEDTQSDETVRLRKMTDSGKQYFESQVAQHQKKIAHQWEEIEKILEKLEECSKDLKTLSKIEKQLVKCRENYISESKLYMEFLLRKNTHESNLLLTDFNKEMEKCSKIVNDTITKIKSMKLDAAETISRTTDHSSKHSTRSSYTSESITSSHLAMKRAAAEVRKTKVRFAKQEADLIKQKARLIESETQSKALNERQKAEVDADLNFLKIETEAAMAVAEIKALEEENESSVDPTENEEPLDKVKIKMTEMYVNEQYAIQQQQAMSACNLPTQEKQEDINNNIDNSVQQNNIDNNSHFCASAQPNHLNNDPSVVTELTKFLLKKELLLSRFQSFNDRAENYAAWKASFKSITEELSVTTFEEMDLLVKWLGPESAVFSQSIRASNIKKPTVGLELIWQRLDERFGRPEMIESAIKKKLYYFSKIGSKENTRYYELLDILTQIQSTKEDPIYSNLLSYFDSSSGIIPIIEKLPYSIQEKWTSRASSYKTNYNVSFPPFSFFVNFIREICVIKNDPAFHYHNTDNTFSKRTPDNRRNTQGSTTVFNRRTDINVKDRSNNENLELCPIHNAKHTLISCRAFKAKSYGDRTQILKDNKICYKCCWSNKHGSRNCTASVKCDQCGSKTHLTIMHQPEKSNTSYGGEQLDEARNSLDCTEGVSSKCTSLCNFNGRSCGKTILVNVYPKAFPDKAIQVYAILDDQSNRTLAKPELFDKLAIDTKTLGYTMSTCAGKTEITGRCARNIVVESLSGGIGLTLSSVIECKNIPNERSEIPTPDVATLYPHLRQIAGQIPHLNNEAQIQLLIGRDVPEAHHQQKQITGPKGTPFAQKMTLGWVIIGEVCLGKVHKPKTVNVNRTHIMSDGRGTIFEPCKNNLFVQEHIKSDNETLTQCLPDDNIFRKTKDDEKIGTSIEDRAFISMMDNEFTKDANNHWSAPLPFKHDRLRLPNNRELALKRAHALDSALKKDTTKCEHFVEFMRKIIDNKAAEVAPPINNNECWYLPLFGVYHPNKPTQIRGVFDSSATFKGVSLNSVMMTGPDLTNSLLGILLRFRREQIAVTVDIEQMFYQFFVREEDRDFLRFFWYKDNNPDNPLIEYRMCVHVFGNSPSPAIATYGLRRTVENCEQTFGLDVKSFIERDFYVDDGLISRSDGDQVVDLVIRAQKALQSEGSIRLHKITSNSTEVMKAFPNEDLGKDIKHLNLGEDSFPIQHSLGLAWDLNTDKFIFNPLQHDKPYTRRGILSALNSIYDPIGFLAPLTISGKILLRESSPPGTNWDDPLSTNFQDKWNTWRKSILSLQELHILRMYFPISVSEMSNVELLIFSDASEKAIAAAGYLRGIDDQGQTHIGFVMGKSKLAPISGNTIPRLELCGAVLATEIASIVSENLDIPLEAIKYFCDSKVVLGYIGNQTRRFHTYVSNRVERILKVSDSSQWNFVPTLLNPADCGTRYLSSVDVDNYVWLSGTSFLKKLKHRENLDETTHFPLVNPNMDKELRSEVNVSKIMSVENTRSIATRFEKFSNWKRLVKAISLLKHLATSFKRKNHSCEGWHVCENFKSVNTFKEAEQFVIKATQEEAFHDEIERLSKGLKISKKSSISALSPFLDSCGILRVGGRLNKVKFYLQTGEINPIIIPKNSHVTRLLIDHFHTLIKHQGRHFTEGALRSAGYWIVGAKRLVSSFIQKCVVCRKLRGKFLEQKMADLPEERLTPGPPFTFVGLDTFGPWEVLTRKTRGGSANSKRWAILFTCMTTRAVHIELIESLSSSSFINALRRFQSIRGPVKVYCSDRGSNFVGATDDLDIEAIHVEDKDVKCYLYETGTVWKFNPPHSSHMGGVWERMIGVTRRILDSVILTSCSKTLTHETLTTFMAEVVAIINSRPIAQISSDPEMPLILSPSMLLTGKQDYLPVVVDSLNMKDMYRAQWKHVRVLSDIFWKKWRSDYLQCLQQRRKWFNESDNLKIGDVVLLRDKSLNRGEWPLGIITDAIKSEDDKVRKACVRVCMDGKSVTYTRPISEIVLLVD